MGNIEHALPASPATVLEDLRTDLRLRGGMKVAAERIGSNSSTFSRLFAQGQYLTPGMASRLADAYGYNSRYLCEGIGELMAAEGDPDDLAPLVAELQAEISSLKAQVAARETTIATLVEMLHAAGVTVQGQQ